MRQVWNTVSQFHMLEQGDKVLLGVSGGPDSVALLHLLHSRAEEYGVALHVVHVHHMLRPEADQEAVYVEQLAEQYGIPFRLYKIDVAEYARVHKLSLEQAGHAVRFQCFQDAKAHWGVNKLALGHHRDDRAESVLMHMVQGCGLDGLTAMAPVDVWNAADNAWLIRPLANVRKQDLLDYCHTHQLQYFVDATNLESEYLRNQIRLELLPQLEQYNPQIADALVRLQDTCSADLDYLQEQVTHLWEQYGAVDALGAKFPAEVFRAQHIAMQRRILRMLYQQWTGTAANLTFAQIEQMCSVAMSAEGSQQISLSGDVLFLRQYDTLYITAKPKQQEQHKRIDWQITAQSVLPIWNGTFSAEPFVRRGEIDETAAHAEHNKNFYMIFADADCLASVLQIRTRQPGDKIQPAGLQGHKTVKKFFIDAKVPQRDREQIPMVLSNDEIVWIPGYFLADCIKITKNTKRFCKLSFSPA